MNNKGVTYKIFAIILAVVVVLGIASFYILKSPEEQPVTAKQNAVVPISMPPAPEAEQAVIPAPVTSSAPAPSETAESTTVLLPSSQQASQSPVSQVPTQTTQTAAASNPQPANSAVHPLPTSVPSAPAGANTGSFSPTTQTIPPIPTTGDAIYINPQDENGASWIVLQNQYMGYSGVWFLNSAGNLYSQRCWRFHASTSSYTYAESCNVNLAGSMMFYNTTIWYENYTEYVIKSTRNSWTNNSWAYVVGGIWINDSAGDWTYIGNSWIKFTNNWKSRVNNSGVIGAWKHLVNESNVLDGKYHQDYFSTGRIFVKSASKANSTGHYLINDTWINVGGAFAMFNSPDIVAAMNFTNVDSYIYNWDTWYFGAENGWVWYSNTWQSWNHFWLWKSAEESYYFDDSTVWVAGGWKKNLKRDAAALNYPEYEVEY